MSIGQALKVSRSTTAGGVNPEAVQAIADRKRERIRDSQLASTSGRGDSSNGHARESHDRRHRDSRDSSRWAARRCYDVHPLHSLHTACALKFPANSTARVCRHRDSRDGSRRSSDSGGQRSEERRRDSRSSSAMRDTHGSRDSWEASTPRRAGGEDEWELTPATVHIAQLHYLHASPCCRPF
jgi:hypothetical protein